MSALAFKVCQLNTVFNGGGTDNQTIELCSGLRQRGHDVLLVLSHGCKWEEVARSRSLPLLLLPAGRWQRLAQVPRLARILRERRIQVIHAHQGRDYWPAILASWLAGRSTRVVLTRHLMTRPSGLSRALLLRAADVAAVSRAVLGVLERELRGPRRRLHQIHCGIDVNAFQPSRSPAGAAFRVEQGWADDAVVFGILGRYRLPRGKGHLEFLEAAAQIKSQFPRARFAIVGRGSMGPLLRERIAALGLQAEVSMLPFTPDVPRIMNALDVVVHPATGTDAFPLTVLEGMASGKPIIASRLDGIPEQFEHGIQGLLIPPADASALAQAMSDFLRQPGRRSLMGAAGRERVCKLFTAARQTERYEALYARLCAPRSQHATAG